MIGKFVLASVLTGSVTGIFIVGYALLTKFLKLVLFLDHPIESMYKLPTWYFFIVPTLSILVVNFFIFNNKNLREYGVREIAEAIEANKFTLSMKDLLLKIFASSLSLASGFAVGNEGPSAAIGAVIAQKIHNLIKLPKKLLKISLSIGASSGIAAVFVSPVTGIMFAIENIAYEFVKNYAGYLILGSVISFSIAWNFLESLIFTYSAGKFIEYRYVYATLLFIPFMTFFIYFYLTLKDIVLKFFSVKITERFESFRNFVFAIIGGSVIGTIMSISPYAVFSGHEVVSILMNDKLHLPLIFIFSVVVLRIIATTVSIYANAIGGIFIALMSIGAFIGYGFAEIVNLFFFLEVEPFYFAAIGAAVFMGVNMRLPLTAMVLALEITYDYNVIVPTGISVVLVTYLASLKFNLKKLTILRLRKAKRR